MSKSLKSQQIRVAVIGAGNRGIEAYGDYIRRRPDQARIVAIADPRADRLQDAAARHGLASEHLYTDWRDLLARETELDAVLITTPDALHLEPALAAIRRGLGILLEKPISPTEEETRTLAEDLALLRSELGRPRPQDLSAHELDPQEYPAQEVVPDDQR